MQALLNAIAGMHNTVDAHRVFHGRGGVYPDCAHWTLDWFAPVWVLTSFKVVTPEELSQCHEALQTRWQTLAPDEPLSWVYQCRAPGEAETRLMSGSVPETHVVTEQGARYVVHVLRGQNHGLFLDMAEGRRWLRAHVAPACHLVLTGPCTRMPVLPASGGVRRLRRRSVSHCSFCTLKSRRTQCVVGLLMT